MTRWIALSRTEHAQAYYRPRKGYWFAAEQTVAPILLAELGRLIPHYVLGFLHQEEAYLPVALLSLDGKTNLYLNADGRWIGSYVPASLRGYPFGLANNDGGDKLLAIDGQHLVAQGEPLFDDAGELSEPIARTLQFLSQCDENRVMTEQMTKALGEAGVIESWPLQISRGQDQESLNMQGLYRVNEKALNALDAETYATLRGGPMALAYAQLFSMNQLNQLTERAKVHAQQGADRQPENLDELFGDDDDFIFDFDS